MRGWLHAYGFGAAVVCGIVLCSLAATRPGWAPLVSCLVYSLTVCALFGTSALYHRRVWSPRGYKIMRRLDHSMIFVLIAGTYTPFCVLLLPRPSGPILLAVVWGGALAGVATKMIWPHARRWLSAPLYVALGWVGIAVLPHILRDGGVAAFVLIVVGGVPVVTTRRRRLVQTYIVRIRPTKPASMSTQPTTSRSNGPKLWLFTPKAMMAPRAMRKMLPPMPMSVSSFVTG